VSHVKLDQFEAGGAGAAGGLYELTHHGVDVIARHLTRRRRRRREGNWAGSDRLPSPFGRGNRPISVPRSIGRGFAAGMGKLNPGDGALYFDKPNDRSKCLRVGVGPDAAVERRDSPDRRNGGGFHHHQSRPADGPAAEMDEMPIGGQAVIAAVLAHWGNENAVAEGDFANLEGRK